MKTFAKLFAPVVVLAAAAGSQAAITVAPPLFSSATISGGALIASGTSVIIADKNGDFNPLTPITGDAFPDAATEVKDVQAIFDGTVFTNASNLQNGIDFTANTTQFYLLLFNSTFDPTTEGPGYGVQYSYVSLGVFPADGDFTDPIFQVDGYNTTTSIPEPASLALLALGGLVVAARRRHA